MHQKRTRPETMPAHTQRRRVEDKHTDRHRPTTQRWVFGPPEFSCPPGTRFTLPNGVHCSLDSGSGEELSFPQRRLPSSASAGLGLTPAGLTPYRKLSPVPDTFLLHSRALDLHWTSCPA
ncbi:unnamed protein product [Rangifer tarandus platyrhynchus]|uniref:Uncharacterized protein n=2 Tax=Rangifer tarandus platyrhynchus TaxID=3082113 RepID=A0ABN8Z918_RANTA|nr:unnamed protein product [Rangifer tarandus platyrhynchus]